eukprot:190497-Amphidinium_carterae.2
MHSAAIQDAEPEEGDEDPTECGLSGPPKKGGAKKKPTPPRSTNVRAAYQSDKGCPDGGGCHTVKERSANHLKAACNRPMASGRNLEAEYADEDDDDQEDAPERDDPDQADEDPNATIKGKGDSKGKGRDGKGRGRGGGRPIGRSWKKEEA